MPNRFLSLIMVATLGCARPSPASPPLEAMHAVGADGTLLRSIDAGGHYERRPPPFAGDLLGVATAGARIYLLGAGGAVLRSDDHGDTFAQVSTVPTGDGHRGAASILATSASTVFVAGHGGVVRSDDAGATWATVPDLDRPIARIVAASARTLYAVAAAHVVYENVHVCGSCIDASYETLSLFRSTDGGRTWQERVLADPSAASPASAAWRAPAPLAAPAAPPATIVISGHARGYHPPRVTAGWFPPLLAVERDALHVAALDAIHVSADGGATFATHTVRRAPADPFAASDAGPRSAIAVTDTGDIVLAGGAGQLDRSTDRGATWQPVSSGIPGHLFAIVLTGGGRAVAVGLDGTIATRDPATATWRAHDAGDAHLYDVTAAGGATIAVGSGGTILRSTDAGATVTRVSSGTTVELRTVWGHARTFIAAGSDGVILRSRDAGATWQALTPLVTDAGISLWGSAPDDLYLVTIDGQQLRSTDAGDTWTDVGTSLSGVITGVWGTGPDDVFLLGWEGRLFHSADRGRTWQPRATGTTLDLASMTGTRDDLWLAGAEDHAGNVLLRSTDGGATWQPEPIATAAPLRAIIADDASLLAVGSGAQLLRRALP